jgi:hypothetical protein
MKRGLISRISGRTADKRLRRAFGRIARLLAAAMFLFPTLTLADAPPRFSLPIGDNQFFDQTEAGVGVVGTFSITGFNAQDGILFAVGVVQADLTEIGIDESSLPSFVQQALTPDGAVVELPVKITSATCSQLTMELGAVPGLSSPILVSYEAPGKPVFDSSLISQDLCEIARIAQTKNPAALAEMLDQNQGPPGALRSCGIFEALQCAGASVTCASACLAGPVACIACLGSIGLLSCKDCLGL